MSEYLLIESRDLYDHLSARDTLAFAQQLVRAGDQVTVFFVEQGVVAARKGELSALLATARSAGVTLLADEFSLKERGIAEPVGVARAPIDVVVEGLAKGHKVIWH